jgi:signal transduction histidine kinase
MSTHVWPPAGPLTRWALGKLEERGDTVAEEVSEELERQRVARDLHEVCGMCVYSISREMGISTEEARRLLDAAGVPRREWR